jgi:hypothetical protein
MRGQLRPADRILSEQMNSSRRVWKWTGAVLAVLCAALGVANFLLTRLDQTPAALETNSLSIQSEEIPGGSAAVPQWLQEEMPSALPRRKVGSDSGLEIPGQARRAAGDAQGIGQRKVRKSDSGALGAIDNRQSESVQSIKPLGLVEKSDGRVQAVIADGEWTRLVEVGEILADGARVAKVSAEGVEILRPTSQPAIELARAGNAAPGETKTEIAVTARNAQSAEAKDEPIGRPEPVQARVSRPASTPTRAADDLPGMQTGDAILHAARPHPATSAVPQRSLRPVLANQTASPPSPVVGIEPPVDPNAAFGQVEYADGRVQSVVADGQWVKLVADPDRSGADFNLAKGKAPREPSRMGVSPNWGGSPRKPGLSEGSAPEAKTSIGGAVSPPQSGVIQDSESVIPKSVEPIGIVEWPEGRTQAVIIEGLAVSLVDDPDTLAETRRALALISSPRQSGFDPGIDDAQQAGRQREDESIGLALKSPTRGPPGELEPPLGLPDELARGQPADVGLADLSRAPPFDNSPGSGLSVEDLPGFESTAAARTEPLQSIKIIPDAILGRSLGGMSGSVSGIHTDKSPKTLSAPESPVIHEPKTGRIVLGYVRLLDGRQKTVVSSADSVTLVDDAADAPGVQPERPAPAAKGAVTSHPQTGGTHQTAGEPPGSGLQSGPRIRDNQGQLHR